MSLSSEEMAILVSLKDLASAGLSKLSGNVANVGTSAAGASQKVDKLSGSMGKAGTMGGQFSTVLTGIGQGIGQQVFRVMDDGFNQLSDFIGGSAAQADLLNRSIEKSDIVFGNSAQAIQTWSDTAAKSMGISSTAAIDMADQIGNLFVSAGVAQARAETLSTSVVQLATDIGTFNHISTDEALQKLQMGLLGSTKGLKTLGITLTNADVNAQALAMGFTKLNGVFSDSDLIQARYAAIMDKTSNAQGAFARESGSAADQIKILQAEVTDLQAKLGEKLLPLNIAVTKSEIALVDSVGTTADGFKALSATVDMHNDGITTAKVKTNEMNSAIKFLTAGLINLDGPTKTITDAVDEFGGTAMRAAKDADQAMTSVYPAFLQVQKDADQIFGTGGSMDGTMGVWETTLDNAFNHTIATMDGYPSRLEAAYAKGIVGVTGDLSADTQSMIDAMKDPISGKKRVKNDKDLLDGASKLGKQVAAGLKSSDPDVRYWAQKVHDDAVNDLMLNESIIFNAKIKDRGADNASVAITTKETQVGNKKAAGGVLTGGRYIFGEGGNGQYAESVILNPGSSGYVVPDGGHAAGGGAPAVHVHFHTAFVPTRQQAAQLVDVVADGLGRKFALMGGSSMFPAGG